MANAEKLRLEQRQRQVNYIFVFFQSLQLIGDGWIMGYIIGACQYFFSAARCQYIDIGLLINFLSYCTLSKTVGAILLKFVQLQAEIGTQNSAFFGVLFSYIRVKLHSPTLTIVDHNQLQEFYFQIYEQGTTHIV